MKVLRNAPQKGQIVWIVFGVRRRDSLIQGIVLHRVSEQQNLFTIGWVRLLERLVVNHSSKKQVKPYDPHPTATTAAA